MIIYSLLLKGSEDEKNLFLELPLYDSSTNTISLLKVNLEERDPLLRAFTFKQLIKQTYEAEAHGYLITVAQSLNLYNQHEYMVADTNAFKQWIMNGQNVNPVTRQAILINTCQNFIVEPGEKPGTYEIFRNPDHLFDFLSVSGKKRKRSDSPKDDDPIDRIFKRIEERRAREQAFLQENP